MARASSLLLLIIFHLSLLSFAEEELHLNHSCPAFPCGILGNISFPFSTQAHPECGLLTVYDCHEPLLAAIQLGKDGSWFYVTEIRQDNTIVFHDPAINSENHTCGSFKNYTLSSSPFYSFEIPPNRTFFSCLPTLDSLSDSFRICSDSNHSIFGYNHATDDSPRPQANCSVFRPQLTNTKTSVFLDSIYTGIFSLQVNVTRECHDCHLRGGQCQIDDNRNFKCSGAIKITEGTGICTW